MFLLCMRVYERILVSAGRNVPPRSNARRIRCALSDIVICSRREFKLITPLPLSLKFSLIMQRDVIRNIHRAG